MGSFDYSQQINAESLVRLVLHTPNRQHFQNHVLAWAKSHGVTPQSVMADDHALEEVAEELSGPADDLSGPPQTPSVPGPSVEPELQSGGDDGAPPATPE